jgi:hypothetical protein
MPVVLMSNAPSRELYEAVAAKAQVDSDRPEGLIVHTATEMADGSVRIVDVWESMVDVDEFERRMLAPALEAVGAPVGPPQRELCQPFHVIR